MRKLLQAVLAFFLGLLLLFPLGAIFGALNLPVYHGWGMAHGAFTTAFPAMVATAFFLMGYIPWFGRSIDAGHRIIASLLVIPLNTVLFVIEQSASTPIWTDKHTALYVSCALILSALMWRARRPILIPLFLLFPVAFDLNLEIMLWVGTSSDAFWVDVQRRLWPLMMASAAAIFLTQAAAVWRIKLAGKTPLA